MAALESLVVVDSDPRSRDAVAFGFEREGCVVHATADGREALALAETGVPQVLVASTAVDGLDAPTLVQAVRYGRRPELPVVVVGDEALRAETVAAGVDDFLARPAYIRDVTTIARLLAARHDGEVRGQLADYGMYFLTRALWAARRSTLVTVQRGKRSGELTFDEGALAFARAGRQSGANAFHQLLLWEKADLFLRSGLGDDAGKRIQKPVERLLEDGARFVTEFETIAARVGGPQVVYAVDEKRLDEVRRQVPAEVQPVVTAYDGKRTLIDVVEDSPFRAFDAVMITVRLVDLGVLVRREPTAPSTLSASLAVKDWLLGTAPDGGARVTVSEEVGRVIAGAQAKAADRTPTKKQAAARKPASSGATTAPVRPRPAPAPEKSQPTAPKAAPPVEKPQPQARTQKVAAPPPPAAPDKPQPAAEKPQPQKAEKSAKKSAPVEKRPQPQPQPVDVARLPRLDPAAIERALESPEAGAATRPFQRVAPEEVAPAAEPAGGHARTGPHAKSAFSALEEEFFARESELHEVEPVDTFDDLVDNRPPQRKKR